MRILDLFLGRRTTLDNKVFEASNEREHLEAWRIVHNGIKDGTLDLYKGVEVRYEERKSDGTVVSSYTRIKSTKI